MSEPIDENTQFVVQHPEGVTTTDRTRTEHDHVPGAILSFADLNTAVRHIRTLIRAGDLAIYIPPAPTKAEEESDHADLPAR